MGEHGFEDPRVHGRGRRVIQVHGVRHDPPSLTHEGGIAVSMSARSSLRLPLVSTLRALIRPSLVSISACSAVRLVPSHALRNGFTYGALATCCLLTC